MHPVTTGCLHNVGCQAFSQDIRRKWYWTQEYRILPSTDISKVGVFIMTHSWTRFMNRNCGLHRSSSENLNDSVWYTVLSSIISVSDPKPASLVQNCLNPIAAERGFRPTSHLFGNRGGGMNAGICAGFKIAPTSFTLGDVYLGKWWASALQGTKSLSSSNCVAAATSPRFSTATSHLIASLAAYGWNIVNLVHWWTLFAGTSKL